MPPSFKCPARGIFIFERSEVPADFTCGIPSIWFVGKSKRPEWVVVRSATYRANGADRPSNWAAIADGGAKVSSIGHFASVAVVSVDQPFQAVGGKPVPLWRGHGMHVRFTALE
jgi:hypothetical protein